MSGTPPEPGEVRISVGSLYGAATRQPMVDVAFERDDGQSTRYQISPDEARRVAALLLECAEAADQDANFMRFMTGTVGLDQDRAIGALREFRGLRDQRRQAHPVRESETEGPQP